MGPGAAGRRRRSQLEPRAEDGPRVLAGGEVGDVEVEDQEQDGDVAHEDHPRHVIASSSFDAVFFWPRPTFGPGTLRVARTRILAFRGRPVRKDATTTRSMVKIPSFGIHGAHHSSVPPGRSTRPSSSWSWMRP